MANEALSSGAELAPISWTFGMSSGRGVVSTRTSRLNLLLINLNRLLSLSLLHTLADGSTFCVLWVDVVSSCRQAEWGLIGCSMAQL